MVDAGPTDNPGDANEDPPDVYTPIDAAPDAPPCDLGASTCGTSFGGDPKTVYLCRPTGFVVSAICKRTCLDGGASLPARCDCVSGGQYCGTDQLSGDPKTLYECQPDHTGKVVRTCKTCTVRPGADDQCSP
jgi:hypothetical protein